MPQNGLVSSPTIACSGRSLRAFVLPPGHCPCLTICFVVSEKPQTLLATPLPSLSSVLEGLFLFFHVCDPRPPLLQPKLATRGASVMLAP